ncbi:lipase member H-like [Bacillus rossius redtenbacheri]|uniref:lipase member H-like n=1 Tax=Bacillus rossius redtenbacheri TaxID=93214 RepID=UPI002FDE06E2
MNSPTTVCFFKFVCVTVVACSVLSNADNVLEDWVQISDGNRTLQWVNLKEEPLESKVSGDDVKFLLYTKKASDPVVLKNGSANLGTINFSDDTVFVIHGWTSNPGVASVMNIVSGYLKAAGSYNVINVDWSGPAAPAYPTAVRNAREVSAFVAQFVDYLVSRGLSLTRLNIIGFSLGAHVAGMAGYRVRSGSVGRVTGLDPAGPLFYTASAANKLNKADAGFVQVIHTNGGVQGYLTALGHADFYPNGGSKQDGCGSDVQGSCAHHRAPAFYAESITSSKPFTAVRCSKWSIYQQGSCSGNPTAVMGAYTPANASGNYWLKTNAESPYAQG